MTSPTRPARTLILLATAVVFLFLLDISLGSVRIPPLEIIYTLAGRAADTTWTEIILHFRLPKAVTCVLAGCALSGGGLMMQTLFRNPLAGPDVLGLSSGASLLVALVILSGYSFPIIQDIVASPWSVALAASIGAVIVFLLVIVVAARLRDNASLLIVGLMISATAAAAVGVLQFLSRAENLQAFMIWSLGTVGSTTWTEIRVLAIVVIAGSVLALTTIKSLNAWLLGEHYAQSIGINIRRSRFKIMLATSLLAGGVTAFCGPIAFVGLAVPHLVRLLVHTANHRILLPAVMLGGSLLILFCDILSQVPGTTQLLPLNAVTSLIGAPVVIWVVMRKKVRA